MKCTHLIKNLEYVEDSRTSIHYVKSSDLIDDNSCTVCMERYKCLILQHLINVEVEKRMVKKRLESNDDQRFKRKLK